VQDLPVTPPWRSNHPVNLLARGKATKKAAGIRGVALRTIALPEDTIMGQPGLINGAELEQYAVAHHLVARRG